jgi:acyl carrier protein
MKIKEQVKQFIKENFLFSNNGFTLSDHASFVEEGVVDSTGVLELVAFVEDTYGLKVNDKEIVTENFDSLNSLVAFIERKTA